MRRLLLPLLAALTLLWPAAASADERVLHFLSEVSVRADGTLDVTETIRVRSEGDRIRRGIYREFPTRYTNRTGSEVRVGFEVVSVRRDGAGEPWHIEARGNFIRIYIGDGGTGLPSGEHVYVIRYRTTRQVDFFKEHDELNWEVTGTGWEFPIDVAEARIRLPQAVPFKRRGFHTGPMG
ncbi:MAG TPA: DUF2207 domain-containing protein, partial [Allosphingosinicella sp.]